MSINITKGSSLNLSKEAPSLRKIMIGLGWDTGEYIIDLDTSAFMLSEDGKIPEDEYFVFYNNLTSPDGAFEHTGDNRTGEGDGDDEMILANLAKVNPAVTEIVIIVSIYDAKNKGHHFGLLQNAFIRVYDVDNKTELLKYTLNESHDNCTEIEFGKFHKNNNEWEFTALGIGSSNGLQRFVDKYV